MVSNQKLDFWIQHNYNVLFVGKHGVGKTSLVIEAFKRSNLRYRYFSAATMDPWVDFIGVPRSNQDENGQFLDLIRPKDFRDDSVDALFFDEFNRAPKKVRNAVMELIQFRSINGRKFPNLRLIWAAINPEDDIYDVEKLDPAQKDRFHVSVNLPYECYKPYFVEKYGDLIGESAIFWWNNLKPEQKNEISPRRLDYALDSYSKGGELRDVLPICANVTQLANSLKSGPVHKTLIQLYKDGDAQKIAAFIQIDNNYEATKRLIFKKTEYIDCFLPYVSSEKLSAELSKENKFFKHVVDGYNANNGSVWRGFVDTVLQSNTTSAKLLTKLKQVIKVPKKSAYISPTTGVIKGVVRGANGIPLNIPLENTFYRKKALNTLHELARTEKDLTKAEEILGVLETICKSSHRKTLAKWKLKLDKICSEPVICDYSKKHKAANLFPILNNTLSGTHKLEKHLDLSNVNKDTALFIKTKFDMFADPLLGGQ